MTTNYKILGQSRPAADTEAMNYSVPELTSTLVKSINITNTSSTEDSYTIAIKEDGAQLNLPTLVVAHPGGYYTKSSTDLITWTQTSLTSPKYWSHVTYGPQGWLASGYDNMGMDSSGSFAKSSNPNVSWSSIDTGMLTPSSYIQGSFYADGKYNVYTLSGFYQSTDLITWADNYLGIMSNFDSISKVIYGSGKFLSTGPIMGSTSTQYSYSTNGSTWTLATIPFVSGTIGQMSFVNDKFIVTPAETSIDEIATSTDGITWTVSTFGVASTWRSRVVYANGKYVIAPYTGFDMDTTSKVLVSTDAVTWSVNTLPTDGMFTGIYNRDITFFNGNFLISGEMFAKSYKSTDAVTWTIIDGIDPMDVNPYPWSQSASANALSAAIDTESEDYIAYNVHIDGNETITIKSGYTLSQNDAIRVKSANGTTTFSTFGAEIS